MQLASGSWETATLWTPLGVIGGLALTGFLVVLTWRLLPRQQRLYYSIFETPMLSGMNWLAHTQSKIKVIIDDEEIAAPRVVTVRLVAKGTHDIPASSFDRARPLVINFGSRVAATEAGPGGLEWQKSKSVNEDAVRIAPMLIRNGSSLTFTAIVDGPVFVSIPDPPLVDVKVVQREWDWNAAPWLPRNLKGVLRLCLLILGAIIAAEFIVGCIAAIVYP
jgi:hypothetical protein